MNELQRDALDHIVKVCKQSRTQTMRIRWIAARAQGALDGKEYRPGDYQMAPNGDSEYQALQVRYRRVKMERDELLAKLAASSPQADSADLEVCHRHSCKRKAMLAQVEAYRLGWIAAARWAGRDDLPSDVDSPAYIRERDAALCRADPPSDGLQQTSILRALRMADTVLSMWENGHGFDHHGPAREAQRLVTEALEALRNGGQSNAALAELLPGAHYMDPPDGGDVTVMEQLRRMAKDAERYRWLRDECPEAFSMTLVMRREADEWAADIDRAMSSECSDADAAQVSDARRLDWLSEHELDLVTRREDIDEDEYRILWFVIDSRESTTRHLRTVSGHPLGSPREAIDAAIAALNQRGGGDHG